MLPVVTFRRNSELTRLPGRSPCGGAAVIPVPTLSRTVLPTMKAATFVFELSSKGVMKTPGNAPVTVLEAMVSPMFPPPIVMPLATPPSAPDRSTSFPVMSLLDRVRYGDAGRFPPDGVANDGDIRVRVRTGDGDPLEVVGCRVVPDDGVP